MISRRLLQHIQDHAHKLTADLVHELQGNPRTAAYRLIPAEQLMELKGELFAHLGRWLSARSKFALESRYRRLGRERYLAGIPLSQVVWALNLTKCMLLEFIFRATPGDVDELHLEQQLVMAITEFFNEATYLAALGYEDATRACLIAPREHDLKFVPTTLVLQTQETAAGEVVNGELGLPVSRGGDIGESPG